MERKQTTRRLCALGITLIAHIFFVGLLYFLSLEQKEQKKIATPELLLIDVGIGESSLANDKSMGGEESQAKEELPSLTKSVNSTPTKLLPQQLPPSVVKPTSKPEVSQLINTQTHPKSLPIATKKVDDLKKKQEEETTRKAIEEARIAMEREAVEQEAKRIAEQRKQIGNSISSAFGNKGNGNKTLSSGNGDGRAVQGGSGSSSLSLVGRTIISNGGQLTSPIVRKAVRGYVVVRIIVTPMGVVSETSIFPKGTTISDESIRQAALLAAKTTKFNAVESETNQQGTITYNFDIK